jgi:hypothetical protein
MSIESKIKAKDIISTYGEVEITVVDGDKVEHKKFTSYEDVVSEVEFYESMDCEVYL